MTEVKIETLEDVRIYLSNVPLIDYGGCGIAALAIVRWAKKNWSNFSCSFLLGQNFQEVFENNVKAMLTPNSKMDSASHVGLVLINYETKQQYVIDSSGFFDMNNFAYTNVINSEELMLQSINEIAQWNPRFNRAQVAVIAKTLDIDLSDIDCRDKYEFLARTAETAKNFAKSLWEMIV